MDWIHHSRQGPVLGCCERDNETSGSIESWWFVEYLNDHQQVLYCVKLLKLNWYGLLRNLLHGAGYYLKIWLSLSLLKNPTSLRNPEVIYRAHKIPPLDPILSQLNPVCPIDPFLPKVHTFVEQDV
jgi:hypothetical protein